MLRLLLGSFTLSQCPDPDPTHQPTVSEHVHCAPNLKTRHPDCPYQAASERQSPSLDPGADSAMCVLCATPTSAPAGGSGLVIPRTLGRIQGTVRVLSGCERAQTVGSCSDLPCQSPARRLPMLMNT